MRSGQSDRGDTATQILDVAERLVQTRGFNGFSYADVAAELNITKAALHYHFASKSELGAALIARYAVRFAEALAAVEASGEDAPTRLDGYAGLYLGVLRERRMCLCGMLAAEYHTLPVPMQGAVVSFFDENEAWLTRILSQGQDEGTLQFDGSPSEIARVIVSGLEGAMLVARSFDDLSRFESAASHILAGVGLAPSRPA
ncbi:MAG: TetR/AcrR family transcriptional regulator [Acidimicrobiales bacterium]|jgi:TetR/AcrR family transcriptional regulator, transcriptional repressor for nem operon